jgi:hypothetical protein
MSCEKNKLVVNNQYSIKKELYNTSLVKKFEDNHDTLEKMIDFPKYVPNCALKQFLVRYELIKMIKDVPGDIIECGVCGGRGLFSLLQSHLLLEPNFYYRSIIGFDTFDGFTSITDKDNTSINKDKDFSFNNMNELNELGQIHTDFFYSDLNKVKLIKGDAVETIPKYIEENQHTIVSLLYLDFDLYLPTKIALEYFIPRMPKGSIIAFDEIHFARFPGETLALLEKLNINNFQLKNLLNSNVNYLQL